MFCDWSTMGAWAGTAMMIGWLALIGLVAWALATFTRRQPPRRSSPMTILEERFARGEIGSDEYLERRSALEEVP